MRRVPIGYSNWRGHRIFTAIVIGGLAISPEFLSAADDENMVGELDRGSVEDAITGVRFDDVIFVSGGNSLDPDPQVGNKLNIITGEISGSQTLGANRTLMGGGSAIRVRELKTGSVKTYTAPGTRPVLLSGSGPGLRIEGDDVHVAGLTVRTTGDNNAVSGGSDRTNIAIEQMDIEAADRSSRGIRFGNNNTMIRLMKNIVVSDGDGIRFGDGNRDIEITENSVTVKVNGQAMRLGDTNSDIRATGNRITAEGGSAQGIRIGGNNEKTRLSENTFERLGGDVFVFSATGNSVSADSLGNVVTTAPDGVLCGGSGSFTGTFKVAVQGGVVMTFKDGCTQ